MKENFVLKAKKAIKKIAAISTGVAMLGATLTGAMALDLADYPAPFVKDGVYDSTTAFVVGEKAAASDTLGALDIVANLQFEAKECTKTGGTVTVTGGKTEDIPLGYPIATSESKTLDTELQDDDISILGDGQITFNSATVDYEEVLAFGTSSNLSIETSLTAAEDDYKSDPYMEAARDSIKYFYLFEDALTINASTSTAPLKINFLGKTLKVTAVSSNTKFTALVGTEYFIDATQSVTVDGKTITLKKVGNTAVVVEVDGTTETIASSGTETVNGMEITVNEIFYDSNNQALSSATLVVGKDSQETYKDGDAYVGEDEDDPDWIWDIGNLHNGWVSSSITAGPTVTGPYFGIENDFVYNDASDNPPGVGECINLPNDFISICIDSLKVGEDDYATYTFEFENSADLSDADGSSYESVRSVYMHTAVNEGFIVKQGNLQYANASTATDIKTDKIWIAVSTANGATADTNMTLYYENTNNKVVNAGAFSTGVLFAELNYENTKGSDVTLHGFLSGINLNITVVPYHATYLPSYNDNLSMVWTYDATNNYPSSLGSTLSSEEAGELIWGTRALGTKDEDHLSRYGIIVKNPKSHGASDEVVIEVPGDAQRANVVVKGSTTTTAGGTTTCTVAAITPVTKTDAEVAGSEANYNLILVGGPRANKAVEAVTALGITGAGWDLKAGEGIVKLAANGDKVAMLVAGTTALDTRRAAKVVANYKDYTLKGTEVLVKGTTLTDITVE